MPARSGRIRRLMLDYSRFDALTFDCYGTLIDWETGLADAFRPVLAAQAVERRRRGRAQPLRALRGGRRGRAVPDLPRRRRPPGCAASPPSSASQPSAEEVAAFSGLRRGLAGVPRLGRGARSAQGALPARRDHELRRRPVRRLQPQARRRVRLDRHRRSRSAPTSPTSATSTSRSSASACRASGSSTSRRACSTTTSPRSGSGSRRSGSTAAADREGSGATPVAAATPDATFPDHGRVRRRGDRLARRGRGSRPARGRGGRAEREEVAHGARVAAERARDRVGRRERRVAGGDRRVAVRAGERPGAQPPRQLGRGAARRCRPAGRPARTGGAPPRRCRVASSPGKSRRQTRARRPTARRCRRCT